MSYEQDEELREFIKAELVWLADFLRRKEGLSVPQIRKFLIEILGVTI